MTSCKHKSVQNRDNDSATTEPTEQELMELADEYLYGDQPTATASNPAKKVYSATQPQPAKSSQEQVIQGEAEIQRSGTVEIFARVKASSVSYDVPVPTLVVDNEDLKKNLLAYAAWRDKLGASSQSISFDMWCSIHNFGT